jgi:RNA polymerase sigma-70 factor (ECF subfamily)
MKLLLQEIDIPFLQHRVGLHRDERSYKSLFLFFHKDLLRFAFSIVKSQEASEEIVSDVMMKLWSLREGILQISNLKLYLFQAIKNTSLNYLSRNQNYTSWDIEHVSIQPNLGVYDPEEEMLQEELLGKIAAAIDELPPKCQMVYKLVREDGFSYKEVAEIMSISENTVDRHLNNALHKLMKAISTYVQ